MNARPISAVTNPIAVSTKINNAQSAKTGVFRKTALMLVINAVVASVSWCRIIGSAKALTQKTTLAKITAINKETAEEKETAEVAVICPGVGLVPITIDTTMARITNIMPSISASISSCPISWKAFWRS